MLNEREMRESRHVFETSEILTCHQVGLDRQSHHAHKDVAAKGAILGPDPSQLWVDIKKSASNDLVDNN